MSSKYFRVGRSSDLIATNDIVTKHSMIKEQVLKTLDDLADEAENITLTHINQEMDEHWWSGLGRSVVVVGGGISLVLLFIPVLSVASAPLGIVACVVGYAIIGKSIYECRANTKERIEKMKNIYKEVEDQLELYKVSQQTVFTDLESYDFSQGKDFKANMEKMANMIENAEKKEEYGCCNKLEDFLKKIKTQYLELSIEQKETLESEKFQMDMKEFLTMGASILSKGTAGAGLLGDVATGVTHNTAAAVGSGIGMWGNLLQGVNILINGCFLTKDVLEYRKLKKMRNDFKAGDKEQIKKEAKFKDYFDLKNEILEITKKMRSGGY